MTSASYFTGNTSCIFCVTKCYLSLQISHSRYHLAETDILPSFNGLQTFCFNATIRAVQFVLCIDF